MSKVRFPEKEEIEPFVGLLAINEETVYRLPRVLVLRQLVERPSEYFLCAMLKDQGTQASNIVYDISNFDQENNYFLIEINFTEETAILGRAVCWYYGGEIDKRIARWFLKGSPEDRALDVIEERLRKS